MIRAKQFLTRTVAAVAAFLAFALFALLADSAFAQGWQEEFDIAKQKLASSGKSKYFVLEPGFQIVLASDDEKLTITVLDETKEINGIITRVVEEREEEDGELTEVSRNFFAINRESGDLFYFGETVDIYEDGKIAQHDGAWLAYKDGAKPGLIMAGNPQVGKMYYQEVAPEVAMDRAEIVSVSEKFNTPAGAFENCLKTKESSKIKPDEMEYKLYAPGIGLIKEHTMKLIKYGFVEKQ